MLRTAAARAFIKGRTDIMPDDVKAVFKSACRHRLTLTQRAKFGNAFDLNDYLDTVLDTMPVNSDKSSR